METKQSNIMEPEQSNTEETKPTRQAKQTKSKMQVKHIALMLVGALFVSACIASGYYLYKLPVNHSFVRAVTNVLPLPIAKVNGDSISFKQFYVERDIIFKSVEQTPETEAEIGALENEVLNTMLYKMAVTQLANQYDIELNEERVQTFLDQAAEVSGSEDAYFEQVEEALELERGVFMDIVIKPLILSEQVEQEILNDEQAQASQKELIQSAKVRLDNDEPFQVVAGSVSEDLTAQVGGAIGKIDLVGLPPEWQEALVDLELDVPSDMIEIARGYSIIVVHEKFLEEGELVAADLSVIVVAKSGLDVVVDRFLTEATIWNSLEN